MEKTLWPGLGSEYLPSLRVSEAAKRDPELVPGLTSAISGPVVMVAEGTPEFVTTEVAAAEPSKRFLGFLGETLWTRSRRPGIK